MDLSRHALRLIQDTGQTHCHDEKQGLAACSFGQQMNNMITLQWRTWAIWIDCPTCYCAQIEYLWHFSIGGNGNV